MQLNPSRSHLQKPNPRKAVGFVAPAAQQIKLASSRLRFSLNTRAAAANEMAAATGNEELLLQLSNQLLQSIADRDWKAYSELCDERLTCFEPEAVGHLVEGLPFHKFYFDLLVARGTSYQPPTNTISQPHVRLLGSDAAVVSYIRLQQKMDANGRPVTVSTEETRVWEKRGGKWRNVHFHRSPTTPSG